MIDLTDDAAFRAHVDDTITDFGIAEIDFANALAVSVSTVRRWRNGRSVPHPAMRKPVFAVLSRMVSEQVGADHASGNT